MRNVSVSLSFSSAIEIKSCSNKLESERKLTVSGDVQIKSKLSVSNWSCRIESLAFKRIKSWTSKRIKRIMSKRTQHLRLKQRNLRESKG